MTHTNGIESHWVIRTWAFFNKGVQLAEEVLNGNLPTSYGDMVKLSYSPGKV